MVREREGKTVPLSLSSDDAPKKNLFYALLARVSKLDDDVDDDDRKFLYFSL